MDHRDQKKRKKPGIKLQEVLRASLGGCLLGGCSTDLVPPLCFIFFVPVELVVVQLTLWIHTSQSSDNAHASYRQEEATYDNPGEGRHEAATLDLVAVRDLSIVQLLLPFVATEPAAIDFLTRGDATRVRETPEEAHSEPG